MIKKLLVIIAVLGLIAGTAYAAALDDGLTREVWAQNTARSVTTDNSVFVKVWALSGGATNPGVGVSNSTTIIVYENYVTGVGHTISSKSSSYDTVGEIVDFINTNLSSDSSVKIHASVGRDARRSTSATTLVVADIIAASSDPDTTTAVVKGQTGGRISVGVEGKANKINRIKSFNCQLPAGYSATGADGVTYTVYDGDDAIWKKYVTGAVSRATQDMSNSANSVKFSEGKGVSVKTGNSLMVEAVSDTRNAAVTSTDKTLTQISIEYDQF